MGTVVFGISRVGRRAESLWAEVDLPLPGISTSATRNGASESSCRRRRVCIFS